MQPGVVMSDFVEFPEKDYVDAGNVFESFNGATSDFTLENALAMMWFAQLAYEVDESGQNRNARKIETVRKLWGFTSITPFLQRAVTFGSALHTTGLIGVHNKAIVLAFAGTDPAIWETAATDARFDLSAKNTHAGFQAAFDAVAPVVNGKTSGPVGEAMSLRTDAQPLFITGHSLGAAVGILAAAAVDAGGVEVKAVYGFGTPRPGGTTFRDAYNTALGKRTYRMVHGRDIVARVPMFTGYSHVGRLLRCKQGTMFNRSELTDEVSPNTVFSRDYIKEIAAHLLGGGIFGFVKSLVMNPPHDFAQLAQAVKAQLPERGTGPLAEWFRALPPFIREHLQDQYIKALTPGAARVRSDV